MDSCPPGYYQISSNNTQYCYEISEPSAWDSPCFNSGGASVITDLNIDELDSLMKSLASKQTSKYFWLPAQRQKLFNPVVWIIPGPNWSKAVESSDALQMQSSLFQNCLLLDIENRLIKTEMCNYVYPSLCFYINDLHYPAMCPNGYQAFRFMPDEGVCFGFEESLDSAGSNLTDFLGTQCKKPMGDNNDKELIRHIYYKMANPLNYPNSKWCWYFTLPSYANESMIQFGGVINGDGTLGLLNANAKLSCMVCEKDMIYGEPQFSFEYNYLDMKMYLTIYYASSLWKYYNNDKGVRCFTNAKGFVQQVPINESPITETLAIERDDDEVQVDKTVYVIDLVTNRTAEYWCEGHTKNFSFITTNRITVSPIGNQEYVFALYIKSNTNGNLEPDFDQIVNNVTEILEVKRVYLMDIINITTEYTVVLLHLHVTSSGNQTNDQNLQETFYATKSRAQTELPKHNIIFLNIYSSIFCFRTISEDIFPLEWELTLIGQITAPKQFCLQANGLPVKRRCTGSYLTGGVWGPVDGNCNKNYTPSNTTTYLYNLVKGNLDSSNFLTTGLHYVLDDIDIIIPADIYYLAMSLNQVAIVAQENNTSVEMGDLENIAWAMDRLMVLDNDYLGLAQTLNSTNLILDSISEIIDVFATINITDDNNNYNPECTYQIAIKEKFVIQISYPGFTNVTGIALIRNLNSDLFTDMKIKPLYKNTTMADVLALDNLEIATWIPQNVIHTLKVADANQSCNSTPVDTQRLHVVIHIFHNDAVFQDLHAANYTTNSRIIDVSIPGYTTSLDHYIPLIFKDTGNLTEGDKFCGFWDFEPSRLDGIPGFWRKDGCFFAYNVDNLTLCECYHLTHFAQLINLGGFGKGTENVELAQRHKRALNTITLVGSFLSLIGISGIFITASIFSAWRQKQGTKILLQLSTAIALPLIIIVYFSLDHALFIENDGIYSVPDTMKDLCIGLGAFLHYSILASFVWMLITAILQFIRYVKVLSPTRPTSFMLKISLLGWGLPTLPVFCLLLVDFENYLPTPSANFTKALCYPSGFSLILGVIVPIGIILLTNVVLFLLIMLSISRGPNGTRRVSDIDLVKAQLRLSVFLFFLLGLTWLFGIFSFSPNMWWSYMFCLTSTLQGFVLFLYFVICDPVTRSMWYTMIKPQFRLSTPRESISTCSNISSNHDLKA